MGQMTHALMIGTKLPDPPDGKLWRGDSVLHGGKWVYQGGILDSFDAGDGPKLEEDNEYNITGFFVAVGASGKRGVPYLEGPIDLVGIEDDERYQAAGVNARRAWGRFVAYLGGLGITLDPPRLWLVEVEVS